MNAPQTKTVKDKARSKSKSTTKRKSSRTRDDIKKLYELGTAFWASGALIAAIKLSLFTKLGDGGMTSDAVARKLGTNKRWTEKLLIACAAMGLLEKKNSLFSNSSTAA